MLPDVVQWYRRVDALEAIIFHSEIRDEADFYKTMTVFAF